MIHPATEVRFIDPDVGSGVFATAPIPRGTLVWVLCALDIVLTPAERRALPPAYHPVLETYAYVGADGHSVLCWDHGRSINHSCEPVMRGLGPALEIAVRDIAPGEQITCEYGGLNLPWRMRCMCASSRCRGIIAADDVLALWHEWDAQVAASLPFAAAVPQPLLPFARDAGSFHDWVAGKAQLPSHRDYHAGSQWALKRGTR